MALTRTFLTRSQATQTATVAAGTTLVTLPSTMLGVLVQPYMQRLLLPQAAAIVNAINPQMIRFAGSTGDYYNWITNSNTPSAPANPFIPYQPGAINNSGYYANALDALGVSPGGRIASLTANYGSAVSGTTNGGDSVLAANWICNAFYNNIGWQGTGNYGDIYAQPDAGRNYGSSVYISPGNEQYNAGGFEVCNWANKLAAGYSANLSGALASPPGNFIAAMRAVDTASKVKIGIDLQSDTFAGGVSNWNQTLIANLHASIDYVKIHYSPGPATDYALLHAADAAATICRAIQSELNTYAGADASRIKIFFDAYSTQLPTPFTQQTTNIQSALVAIDSFFALMLAGCANMTWAFLQEFEQVNGLGAYFGPMLCGDLGIQSSGGAFEPPQDTPMPSYYGLWLIGQACSPGDALVKVTNTGQDVRCYAIKRATDGKLALVHINRSLRATSSQVTVNGYSMAGTASQITYDANAVCAANVAPVCYRTLSGLSSPFTLPLTPYSITLTILN